MILGYSRMLYTELLERCDMVTFLEAHIRAVTTLGGVPHEVLYDRMRNVFLRQFAGKTEFTQSLVNLRVHYGFTPRVAPAYAPWIKGKVERPLDFVCEGFWRGYLFTDLAAANHDLDAWLKEKAQRLHGTTTSGWMCALHASSPSCWRCRLRPVMCQSVWFARSPATAYLDTA